MSTGELHPLLAPGVTAYAPCFSDEAVHRLLVYPLRPDHPESFAKLTEALGTMAFAPLRAWELDMSGRKGGLGRRSDIPDWSLSAIPGQFQLDVAIGPANYEWVMLYSVESHAVVGSRTSGVVSSLESVYGSALTAAEEFLEDWLVGFRGLADDWAPAIVAEILGAEMADSLVRKHTRGGTETLES